MGRKQIKINAIRGKRLKTLLNEKKIDQKEFAEEIGYSAEHISYIINGKRNLTEDAAGRIAEKFPDIRIGWLLGWDDFKTEEDENEYERLRSQRAGIMEQEMMRKIAHQAGYDFSYRGVSMDDALRGEEAYIFLSSSGEAVGFTLSEYWDFWYDFMDYAVFRLKRTIEKKYISNNIEIDMGDNSPSEGGTGNG